VSPPAAAAAAAALGASISKLGLSVLSGARRAVESVTDMVEGELQTIVAEVKGGGLEGGPAGARRKARGSAAGAARAGAGAGGSKLFSRFDSEVRQGCESRKVVRAEC
jgi:hypothetical protein